VVKSAHASTSEIGYSGNASSCDDSRDGGGFDI